MKIRSSHNSGSTLMVVMMISGVLIAALGTYLNLTSQEHKTVRRSLCWNAALPMAEAGIEETLSHLNKNYTNYAAEGWTSNYRAQRNLGSDGYYAVNFSGKPGGVVTITSTGYVRLIDDQYISRTIQVRGLTTKDFKFPGLMAQNISFGGNFSADSYDSSDPAANTGGQYDPKKASDAALIATPLSVLDLGGSASILGYIASGPKGTYSAGGASSVGDKSFHGKGVQSGHFTNNFTISLPSAEAPYTEGDLPAANMVNGTNYDYSLEGGAYLITNLNASVYGGTIFVSQSSILYVTGTVAINKIIFAPGVRLDMYVAAPNISFGPVILGAPAPLFTIFALPSCLSLTLTGGTALTGLIYAPDSDLHARGHSSVSGAIVGKSFDCLGTFDFHFDLAFSKPRFIPPVRVLSWAEL